MKTLSSLLPADKINQISPYVDIMCIFLPKSGEVCIELLDEEIEIINDLDFQFFRFIRHIGKTAVFLRKEELLSKNYKLKWLPVR